MKNANKTDFILCWIPEEAHLEPVRAILLHLSMTGRHDPRGGGCETPPPVSQALELTKHQIPS
eukprot:85607-Rhodomonas_salina.1